MKTLAILTAILLASCAQTTTHAMRASYGKLHPGMTKTEVEAILGRPGNTQFKGNREVWQYRSFGMVETDHLVLIFQDGKLVSQQNSSGTFHHSYLNMNEFE